MRYQLASLSLAVVLGVLPGLTTAPAAPAPERPKTPTIYALLYVGLGKNDSDNRQRITAALHDLPLKASYAIRDPKVRALSLLQKKEKELGWIERDKWVASKTRTSNLEGTAVVRVWFTEGSPEEQVLIINTIARVYVKPGQENIQEGLKELERHKARFKSQQEAAGAKVTKEDAKVFQRQEEAIRHPPQVIEWANLPEKP